MCLDQVTLLSVKSGSPKLRLRRGTMTTTAEVWQSTVRVLHVSHYHQSILLTTANGLTRTGVGLPNFRRESSHESCLYAQSKLRRHALRRVLSSARHVIKPETTRATTMSCSALALPSRPNDARRRRLRRLGELSALSRKKWCVTSDKVTTIEQRRNVLSWTVTPSIRRRDQKATKRFERQAKCLKN